MYQYYQNSIKFAEKPASVNELAVAEIIKKLHRARMDQSVEQIMSFYDENATIRQHSTRKNGTKKEFEDRLRANIKNLRSTYFGDTHIRITDGNRAVVAVTACYRYTTYTIGPTRILFVMEKKTDQWRIVESECIL